MTIQVVYGCIVQLGLICSLIVAFAKRRFISGVFQQSVVHGDSKNLIARAGSAEKIYISKSRYKFNSIVEPTALSDSLI
jgi:hypothetical protein